MSRRLARLAPMSAPTEERIRAAVLSLASAITSGIPTAGCGGPDMCGLVIGRRRMGEIFREPVFAGTFKMEAAVMLPVSGERWSLAWEENRLLAKED